MERALVLLLCALVLLLLAPGDASSRSGGAQCRDCAYGPEPSSSGTACPCPCPVRGDGADAELCCGACSTGEAARVDHCPSAGHPAASMSIAHGPGSAPPPPGNSYPKWGALLFFITVLVWLLLCAVSCYCRERFFRGRSGSYWLPERSSHENEEQIQLESPSSPPPPYAGDPPTYSIEDPQGNQDLLPPSPVVHHANAGNPEEGAPLMHRKAPGCASSEPVLETEL